MPVAIFIGHYPLYYAAAATTGAYGLDEFEIAGGYLGEPVRLVKCETVDLEVPADAEIVLEGHIPPHYREASVFMRRLPRHCAIRTCRKSCRISAFSRCL